MFTLKGFVAIYQWYLLFLCHLWHMALRPINFISKQNSVKPIHSWLILTNRNKPYITQECNAIIKCPSSYFIKIIKYFVPDNILSDDVVNSFHIIMIQMSTVDAAVLLMEYQISCASLSLFIISEIFSNKT